MTDCLVTQPVAGSGLDLLRRAGLAVAVAADTEPATLRPHLATARAVITRNHGLSAAEIAAAPRLRVIVSHGTGTDAIDRAAAARRDIPVLSTPGANAPSVAEHTLALMLAAARAIVDADASIRSGDHGFRYRRPVFDLAGRELGLVGYGRVAREVARRAVAFGLRVSACSRTRSAAELRADGVRPEADLDRLLAGVDIVSLHGVPDPDGGRGWFLDAGRLARLRPHAVLVNTARGALLDEAALAAALRRGELAAAALDVFAREPLPPDSPLLDCPRLVLTPHMGGSSREALDRTSRQAAGRVLAALGIEASGQAAPGT